jgi:hypothetical protein
MVIVRHTAESCPGREGNEAIHPCLHSMDQMLKEGSVTVVGRWADPPAHVSYMVLDAPNAHAISELMMESGLAAHTTTAIRPVMSMD